jgi:plastocyanin
MDGSLFFWLGGVLVAAALGIAAIGIRGKASFPPSRAVLVLGLGAFAAVVVATTALAVVNAQDEQEHREKELAEEEAAAEEGATEEEAAPSPGGQPQQVEPSEPAPPPSGASALNVTSPDDGGLIFEPDGLEATAGSLTIAYSNPSPVPHSLAVEDAEGNVLGETEVFTGGEQEVAIDNLAPGEYVFFCTVPGHREGGMEGDLTVN